MSEIEKGLSGSKRVEAQGVMSESGIDDADFELKVEEPRQATEMCRMDKGLGLLGSCARLFK
jgi:hypothetical protein